MPSAVLNVAVVRELLGLANAGIPVPDGVIGFVIEEDLSELGLLDQLALAVKALTACHHAQSVVASCRGAGADH